MHKEKIAAFSFLTGLLKKARFLLKLVPVTFPVQLRLPSSGFADSSPTYLFALMPIALYAPIGGLWIWCRLSGCHVRKCYQNPPQEYLCTAVSYGFSTF